jgi:hypothetical protein
MERREATVKLLTAGLGLAGLLSAGAASAQTRRAPARPPAKKPVKKPAAAPTAAIAQIEKLGGRVAQIAQNDDRLEVSYRLAGTGITDAALVPLKGLKKVIHLDLANTGVTDAGLANLKGLTDLTELHLEGTKITDKALANLKGLANLEYLNVYGTQVTDAGLDQLAGMKKLKNLYVWQTKVTDAGAEKLKKVLPQVQVVMGWKEPPAAQAAPPAPAPKP